MDLVLSRHDNLQSGFTLLEILLYLGLLGIIMGGCIGLCFAILQSSEKLSAAVSTQKESSFVMDKLKWLIDNNAVAGPPVNTNDSKLVLISANSPNSLEVKVLDNRLRLQRENSESLILTASSTDVKNFSAKQTSDHVLTIKFELNGQTFTFAKFLMLSP
jgi:type II secretory pathway pseudopilin PulG